MFSYIRIIFIRLIIRIMYVFTIDTKKAVITAYSGKQYSCSPKVIAEAMLKKNIKVYFALREGIDTHTPYGMIRIRYLSFKHFYHLMTAKYIVINNSCIAAFLPYRTSQILINTWHGAYSIKTTGNDVYTEKYDKKLRCIAGKQVSIYLASSKEFIRQHANAQAVPEKKFLCIGLPRDDIFFTKNTKIKEKVYSHLNIDSVSKIILYAPTFREGKVKSIDDYSFEPLDIQRIMAVVSAKFHSEFTFVYRAHHTMLPTYKANAIINASNYPDIQDLLFVSDILITDYSSCVWEFALQKKPCFLYTPDIKEFEKEHPFYDHPDRWPYRHFLDNLSLITAIKEYDTSEIKRIEEFLERCKSADDGHATERLLSFLGIN